MIIVIILIVLFLLYLFLISPNLLHRKNDIRSLQGWKYAHRGLFDPDEGIPENSMKAFALAVENGYGIELDVHITSDGHLVVIHDSDTTRVCGEKHIIEQMTLSQIADLRLSDTAEIIPQFEEVLKLIAGKVPLIVEIKSESGPIEALCQKVFSVLTDYRGAYCVESFNPTVVRWFRKSAPRIIRGQLAGRMLHMGKKITVVTFLLQHYLLNFLGRPDFMAYELEASGQFVFRFVKKLFRPYLFAWTVRTTEDLIKAEMNYDLVIFESIRP